jgi:hypothetical protein
MSMGRAGIFLAFMLVACGMALAFSVKPTFIDTQDTGGDSLPTLDVGITVDCETKQVGVDVASNETGEAVEGAMAYLFYTDYTYQPLPNPGKTDDAGKATIPVPGTLRFLKAMFTLRVDAQGFQSREIEFTYAKCFDAQPAEPKPPANGTGQAGGTQGSGQQTPPANTTGGQGAAQQNATQPPDAGPQTNGTAQGDHGSQPLLPEGPPVDAGDGSAAGQGSGQGSGGASACPAGAVVLLLALLIARIRG